MSSETQTPAGFDGPGVAEIMGHVTIAGHCREEVIFGAPFLRVDVPDLPATEETILSDTPQSTRVRLPHAAVQGYTRFYGAAAIYSFTPCSHEQMMTVVEEQGYRHRIAYRYKDEGPAALPEPQDLRDPWADYPDDDEEGDDGDC